MANTKVTTRVIADDAITSDKLASGLTLGGDTTLSGHVSLTDSKEIRFGANDDANIRHDGNNTKFTHTGSGGLYIGADTLGLQVGAHNENFLTAAANGAVTLFHDNAAKLATDSGGVTITGTATATTFAGELSGTITSATTGTTQSASDNSTKVATTAYVTTAISNLVDSSPSALNTLNELAAALGDDANFSTTVTNSIATKLPLAGGTMTGALNMGSQNITNAGTIASGAITSGAITADGNITADYNDTISLNYSVSNGDYHKGMSGTSFASGNTARGLHVFNFDNDSNFGINFWVGTTASKVFAARIDSSGKLGLGEEAPDKQLHIKNTATGDTGIVIENTNNAQNLDIDFYNNVGSAQGRIRYAEGAGSFGFAPNVSASNALTLAYDGSATFGGNVGIKVPSLLAFRANSNEGAIQIGKRGVIYADTGITTQIGNNTYITSANQRVAIENDFGSFYEQYQGKHSFYATTAAESVNALQTFNLQLMMLQNGNVGVGVASPPNTLTIAHQNHGIGLDYVGSTLPDIAGLFTSSTAHTSTAYGDLNIKARTDYGGNYDIGFFTSTNNQTPVLRGAYRAEGDIIHPATERSIADNGILRFTKTASIGNSGADPVFTITKVSYGLYIAGVLTLILVDTSSPWGIQYRRYGVVGRVATYSGGNTMSISLTSEATYSNIDYGPNFATVDTRTSGQSGGTFVINMNTANNGTATVKVIFEGYAAGVTLS